MPHSLTVRRRDVTPNLWWNSCRQLINDFFYVPDEGGIAITFLTNAKLTIRDCTWTQCMMNDEVKDGIYRKILIAIKHWFERTILCGCIKCLNLLRLILECKTSDECGVWTKNQWINWKTNLKVPLLDICQVDYLVNVLNDLIWKMIQYGLRRKNAIDWLWCSILSFNYIFVINTLIGNFCMILF